MSWCHRSEIEKSKDRNLTIRKTSIYLLYLKCQAWKMKIFSETFHHSDWTQSNENNAQFYIINCLIIVYQAISFLKVTETYIYLHSKIVLVIKIKIFSRHLHIKTSSSVWYINNFHHHNETLSFTSASSWGWVFISVLILDEIKVSYFNDFIR